MKVLYLIETLNLGGAEKALQTTLSAVKQRGKITPIVCCLFEEGPIAVALRALNIPVINIAMTSPYNWRRGIFGLIKVIKENKVDLVHTHLFYANIYGRIAAWLSGRKPVVTTLHNPDYTYEDNGRISFKIRKLIDKCTGRLINRYFIAVSHAVKQDYQKHMGFKNINVLYNNIDAGKFNIDSQLGVPTERKALGLCEKDFVLLNIGRLHPQKGQIYLLEAMEILIKTNKHFKLLIVGTGYLRESLSEEIKKRELTSNVFLLGEREDVPRLMQISDVFVFPSIYEAFGVVVTEAMAMEKIIIVSDIEGLREVVGDEGVYVKPKDAKALTEAIIDIHKNPEAYAHKKKAAKERVFKLFNAADTVSSKLEEVYSEYAR